MRSVGHVEGHIRNIWLVRKNLSLHNVFVSAKVSGFLSEAIFGSQASDSIYLIFDESKRIWHFGRKMIGGRINSFHHSQSFEHSKYRHMHLILVCLTPWLKKIIRKFCVKFFGGGGGVNWELFSTKSKITIT